MPHHRSYCALLKFWPYSKKGPKSWSDENNNKLYPPTPICALFINFYPVWQVKRGAEAPWRPILWRWKRPSSCYTLTQCGLNHQGTSKWECWQNGHLTAHLPVWSTGKWFHFKTACQIIAQWDMSKLDIFEDTSSALLDKRSKSNWLSTEPANQDSVWHEQIEPGQLEIGKKIFLSAFIFSWICRIIKWEQRNV